MDGASDRRLKKRESDRRCQRVSRQRKNTRIAYLEGLVDQLREADTSGQLDSLVQRISQLQKERDSFQGKLAAIEAILMPGQTGAQREPEEVAARTPDIVTTEARMEEAAPSFNPSPGQEAMHFPTDPKLFMIPGLEKEPPLPSTDPLRLEEFDYQKYQNDIPSTWPENPTMNIARTTFERPYLGMPYPTESTRSTSLNSSRSCGCGRAKALRMLNLNHWHYGNVTLGSWMEWPSSVAASGHADPYYEDTVVRAIIEGWDAVDLHGNVHPMWPILRVMDESLFKYADGTMNRLAILIGVSRLLLAHIEHSQAIYSTIPSFALESHGQDYYAYAANFISWPGIRRALVTHEHKYCSNRFWRMLINSIRVQWPFEVRDCYLYNAAEASYSISPTFLATLNNFHALGIKRDFFDYYPELRGMALAVDGIPPSITTTMGLPSNHNIGLKNEGVHPPGQDQQPVLSPFHVPRQLGSQGVKQSGIPEQQRETGDMPGVLHPSASRAATTDAPASSLSDMLLCLFETSSSAAEEDQGSQEDGKGKGGPVLQTPAWGGAPGLLPRQVLLPEVSHIFAGRDFI
ncbi:uncharacterized protein A1O9_10545 [Exophiala aquamarina CBS 119918]|uniref:BZIP domain-containing protein n=1 Tax=Exophiala aquamarina CBS 119918 TaxID=1182545 RepID=A0A072PDB5_9EURO|nr:uncharacterized protein A1O9_10545 [Exophiala aquamarina CBS 119918]KEF53570.1 hypothetical protein A1O9_10545 [Exophiala aquamarina CBS 119918]